MQRKSEEKRKAVLSDRIDYSGAVVTIWNHVALWALRASQNGGTKAPQHGWSSEHERYSLVRNSIWACR